MNAPGIPTLEIARLRLRELRGSDFEDYATLYADPEVTRFVGTGETWDRKRAWRHIAFAIDHMGGQSLLFGLGRATYFREIAPEAAMARRAG